jgi:hypothetical protein
VADVLTLQEFFDLDSKLAEEDWTTIPMSRDAVGRILETIRQQQNEIARLNNRLAELLSE